MENSSNPGLRGAYLRKLSDMAASDMAALAPSPGDGFAAGMLEQRPDERWPFYGEDEIAAVAAVLRSGRVNQWTGPDVFAFEEACARRFGGGRAIALANGSLALELALRAFGIGPGDEVVVSPRSFVASASCVRLVGATPVFADVDRDSGNLTAASVADALTDRTRAVIPVHLAGWPADVPGIIEAVRGRGVKVIEDCAQAHGAEIGGASVGSFGDAAAFSFCQDKIISTGGEGGLLILREKAAWQWAWSFKDHGKDFAKSQQPPGEPGMFRWLHDHIGTNWRLTGPQAAIGRIQLHKLDGWIDDRSRNAAIWANALGKIEGLRLPLPTGNALRHAFYKLYFYIDRGNDEEAARLRSEILKRSVAEGLRLFSGSCSEIYREQAFADVEAADCPVSRALGARSLIVEVHPTLRPDLVELRAQRLAEIAGAVLAGA
jgi:dTDP-4-amino-4,6-dideoxygalactose transaminase